MKEHTYTIQIDWKGKGTTGYNSYSRAHQISGVGKDAVINGSSDPDFMGDPASYNPEELFLSSISACHMLWYLHLCAASGVVVQSYSDKPIGKMAEEKGGGGRFTLVELFPVVAVSSPDMVELANSLHMQAHEKCFIANSCNFEIKCIPEVKYTAS